MGQNRTKSDKSSKAKPKVQDKPEGFRAEHRESYYQKKIIDYIKQRFPDAVVWKNTAGPYSQGGVPDISAIIDGEYFGIEVKRPGGRLSELQKAMIHKINKAGGTAGVCVTVEDADNLIKSTLGEYNTLKNVFNE